MDIESAIKFPTKDENWLMKVLIGGVINLIPIVNLLATGFCLKTMREAINGTPRMPEWEDWGELFIKGLIGVIIAFVYLLIPTIIFLVTTGGAIFSMGVGMANSGVIFTMISGLVIGGILAIIFGFFVPMALAMYVSSDSIGNAFRIGEIVSRIKSVFGEYIMAYVVVIVLAIVLSLISIIPFIGWIIAIFGSFYVGVVAANVFGEVYAASVA
ncbi:MAG: DUF4013 domain-containing protein [Candidatus Syntropharchaeia archaeon]